MYFPFFIALICKLDNYLTKNYKVYIHESSKSQITFFDKSLPTYVSKRFCEFFVQRGLKSIPVFTKIYCLPIQRQTPTPRNANESRIVFVGILCEFWFCLCRNFDFVLCDPNHERAICDQMAIRLTINAMSNVFYPLKAFHRTKKRPNTKPNQCNSLSSTLIHQK